MKQSVMITYFKARRLGATARKDLETIKLCKEAGFDTIDIGFLARVDGYSIKDENWERNTKKLAEDIANLGITVDQTHAPFVFREGDSIEQFRQDTHSALEASAIFGVKYFVVHAQTFKKENYKTYNADEALNTSYEFYAPFVERAKELGISIAFENLFDSGMPKGERVRFTATVEEQIAIIDRFNDPSVSACWDFGHGFIMHKERHLEELKKLGKRFTCTHVHDNYLGMDLHLPPLIGKIDWENVMPFLKEIGYTGTFTYELSHSTQPDTRTLPFLKYLYETGEYLLKLYEGKGD